jgi:5-methylcytosine-specific restriction endonuclease McrA
MEWNGKPIECALHHKDGNKHNNKIDNLEILCPNCHSQTDTYTAKNKGKYS